jgi:hypothetical protein
MKQKTKWSLTIFGMLITVAFVVLAFMCCKSDFDNVRICALITIPIFIIALFTILLLSIKEDNRVMYDIYCNENNNDINMNHSNNNQQNNEVRFDIKSDKMNQIKELLEKLKAADKIERATYKSILKKLVDRY